MDTKNLAKFILKTFNTILDKSEDEMEYYLNLACFSDIALKQLQKVKTNIDKDLKSDSFIKDMPESVKDLYKKIELLLEAHSEIFKEIE